MSYTGERSNELLDKYRTTAAGGRCMFDLVGALYAYSRHAEFNPRDPLGHPWYGEMMVFLVEARRWLEHERIFASFPAEVRSMQQRNIFWKKQRHLAQLAEIFERIVPY